MIVVLSRLEFCILEMHGPLVNSHRSSGFHPCRADAKSVKTFCQMRNWKFGTSSARNHFPADVHESVEESTGCNDYCRGFYLYTPDGSYAYNPHPTFLRRGFLCNILSINTIRALFSLGKFERGSQHFLYLILPDIEILSRVEQFTPFPDELSAVALSARTPHSRTL